MAALPGGAADKAGNRYEELWTAIRIAELLRGEVSNLHLEPPGPIGLGVEFIVQINGETWGEQAKATDKHWTMHQLQSQGLLAHIVAQRKLSHGYRLICVAGSEPLEWLTDRARIADTLDAFEKLALTADSRREAFETLTTAWKSSREDAWQYLRGINVEQRSVASLEREASAQMRLLFTEEVPVALAAVRDLCANHIHQVLTPAPAWAWLEDRVTRRLVVGDNDVVQRLHSSVERHGRRVSRSASTFGFVPRSDASVITQALLDEMPRLTIIDGDAGCGKSSVVAEVTRELESAGWSVAVVSMDSTGREVATARQLGEAGGFDESPTVLLAGLAEVGPALMVVEQLDAVSTYGGRMSDNFDAVAELLDEADRAENIHVVLVVRSVDLAGDPRLRQLNNADVLRHTVGLLDVEDIQAHLTAHDAAPPDAATLELLRTPLHLSVYGRLSEDAREHGPRSLQQLYAAYTDELRLSIEKQLGALDWAGIVAPLVNYMSDNERLTAPAAIVDAADRGQLKALESASMLIRDGEQLRFFHESYFDYLFARSFLTAGGDVHDFLATSGQYLFRRAQTRQLIEYLAATDSERFKSTVVQILQSDAIRSHLKAVVINVLEGHEATEEDWRAVEPIAWAGSPTGQRLLHLLSRAKWFDAADAAGRWDRWLKAPETVDAAFNQLISAARVRGQRCAELLGPFAGASEAWRQRLKHLIQWSLNGELADLAVDLVERGLLDDARGPIAVNSDFWSIVYGLNRDDPVAAARVAGAFLLRRLELAARDGAADPFESGHLDRFGQSGHVIMEIAQAAPKDFLDSVLPFVIAAATSAPKGPDDALPQGPWSHRRVGDPHGIRDAILHGCLAAFDSLADDGDDQLLDLLDAFQWLESDELRFIACRALTAGVQAGCVTVGAAIDWLLSDERNLSLGWVSSLHQASRELVAACTNAAEPDDLGRLTDALLAFESGRPGKPSWRYGQFALLSAVPEDLLSPKARTRLGELRRRFDATEPAPARSMEAGVVGSPISSTAAQHMSDDDWLRALAKHDHDRTDWSGDRPVGGAPQLAHTLGEVAKSDPTRFAVLALRFGPDIPATAIDSVIRAVGDHLTDELLADLCLHAYEMHGSSVARSIAWAVQSRGTATAALAVLVAELAKDPDPDSELARTPSNGDDGEPYYGGDLAFAGLNCVRGGAAIAIARLLWESDTHLDLFMPAIDQLSRDAILAVRVGVARAIAALTTYEPAAALDACEVLFDTDAAVLDADSTEQLLRWALLQDPARFALRVDTAMAAGPSVAQRAGRIWATASYHGSLVAPLPVNLSLLPSSARVGAAEVFAANARDSHDDLHVLFEDEDSEVRTAASEVWWRLKEPDPDLVETLARGYIGSAAMRDRGRDVDIAIRVFTGLNGRLPTIALDLCEEIVRIAGTDLGDIRTASAGSSMDLLSLVLRLYRQGDAAERERCLDLVDRLVDLGAHGVDHGLIEER